MDAPAETSIDGIWQLVRAELNGESAHELLTSNTVLELKSGTYTVRYAGEVTDRGTFELGGPTASQTITLNGTEGVNAGRTIPCIYQRMGTRLRICYGLNGVKPTKFSRVPGQEHYLASYQRKP